MNLTNLELSKNETELITNSDFILTKNRIIEKIYALFGMLSETYKNDLNEYQTFLPDDALKIAPKIYKGEQYKNLPYVLMDYPRLFSKEDVFAIRNFFWWGNYFSITLHLSGKYIDMFADVIFSNINIIQKEKWFFGTNENEWEHHFEKNNYILFEEVANLNFESFKNRKFIKIAKNISLEKWKDAAAFYQGNYKFLLEMMCNKNS